MSATWFPGITPSHEMPLEIDTRVAHPARVYDYLLGGKNNFAADQAAAKAALAANPALRTAIRENRAVMRRMTAYLAGEAGIRQFLDIGTGLPSSPNLHEVAQERAPGARVVYVDVDPMVAAYSAPLLSEDGSTILVTADMRDPDSVLEHPELRRLIDFSQPVGMLMTAVVHFVADGSDPWALVRRYMTATAPGSYLALSHLTYDRLPARATVAGQEVYQRATSNIYARTREEVTRFFDGLELVPAQPGGEPAITFPGLWGAEDLEAADSDGSRAFYCGVARRP